MRHPSRFAFCAFATVAALAIIPGCLTRPAAREEPTTKISFETVVAQPAIEKIDLLLMVDNSASMADKQRILADAVPDLVDGLVRPKCVDKKTRRPTGERADPTKPESAACAAGAEPAFPPITDMHIGVISSSLGGLGSSQCQPVNGRHNDDGGHLLARGANGDLAAAGELHFLAWYPDVERNRDKVRHPPPPVPALGSMADLGSAFRDLIVGVGQTGCGLEAQLESVYHFLAQPDPWSSIGLKGTHASYGAKGDIDETLLKQRAAFLRPDSLVAVVVLTDEDDSTPDPLAFNGTGWRFMQPEPLPRASKACEDDPNGSDCMSCSVSSAKGCGKNDTYAADEDPVNIRFHHMKQRYGVDPQFPVQRYVDALTKTRVPARDKEHDEQGNYVGAAGCTNPLFAAKLPTSADDELCKLPRGPRTPGLVYFALIGGVPNTLLPAGDNAAEKIDWTKILGRDPTRWDETGIDSHMIQSTEPRSGIQAGEWSTGGKDLQFACTFDLYERTEHGAAPVRRTCTDVVGCDCDGTKDTPLCDPRDKSIQTKGKAYPTRRPLMVAKALGDQGVVASLCPVQLTAPDAEDYGYRPAVRSITQRLERSLVGTCLPRELEKSGDGVSCLVLAMLPDPGSDSDCKRFGLEPPSQALRTQLRARLLDEEGEEATKLPVCQIPQITVAPGEVCRDASDNIAFCYAEAPAITQCGHALAFTKASQKLAGARFTMQCIQQSTDSDSTGESSASSPSKSKGS